MFGVRGMECCVDHLGRRLMKTHRHRFKPEGCNTLERRLVLTTGGSITPALLGTLSPTPTASGRPGRVANQINSAFDRFTNDYLQAQGAYLSSAAPAATFTTFTTQRINLLSQELTRIFARVPGSFATIKSSHQRSLANNSSVLLQAILYRNVAGANTSLQGTLTSNAVVPPSGTNGASATLYTLTATNSIQTARISMINATKYIATGTFKN